MRPLAHNCNIISAVSIEIDAVDRTWGIHFGQPHEGTERSVPVCNRNNLMIAGKYQVRISVLIDVA